MFCDESPRFRVQEIERKRKEKKALKRGGSNLRAGGDELLDLEVQPSPPSLPIPLPRPIRYPFPAFPPTASHTVPLILAAALLHTHARTRARVIPPAPALPLNQNAPGRPQVLHADKHALPWARLIEESHDASKAPPPSRPPPPPPSRSSYQPSDPDPLMQPESLLPPRPPASPTADVVLSI